MEQGKEEMKGEKKEEVRPGKNEKDRKRKRASPKKRIGKYGERGSRRNRRRRLPGRKRKIPLPTMKIGGRRTGRRTRTGSGNRKHPTERKKRWNGARKKNTSI